MKRIVVYQDRITPAFAERLKRLCPFGAIEGENDALRVNAACKLCGLCAKGDPPGLPPGLIAIAEDRETEADKAAWRGVCVFIDFTEGRLHPVSLELLGKARELASGIGHPVYGVLVGCGVEEAARDMLRYGADEVFCYDDEQFRLFLAERYTAAVEHFVREVRPSVILFGATNAGRSLAPRLAARLRTGLTADCTALEMKESSDLVQIRPAFGGNIMARILTARRRPQMCTVRYKIFDPPAPAPVEEADGGRDIGASRAGDGGVGVLRAGDSDSGASRAASRQRIRQMRIGKIYSRAEVLEQTRKPPQTDISEAELILALGRGVADKRDFAAYEEFAASIGAKIACTRPVAESGLLDPRLQIGLSGRTVKPKLMICAGISGSVQFAAGMSGAGYIVAINTDPAAPIFKIAHLGLVGDAREVLPMAMESLLLRREDKAAI